MGSLQRDRPQEGDDADLAPAAGEGGSEPGTPEFAGHGLAAQ